MVAGKMSVLAFLVFACTLAGLSHGEEQTCSTDKNEIIPKLIQCVTKDHPEYFLTVLTMMQSKNNTNLEKPDFMCSQPDLMAGILKCLLDYVKGCMPPGVADQVDKMLPTTQTINSGVRFLCNHRSDFDDQCVKSRLLSLGQCINSRMLSVSRVTRSTRPQRHMQDALCFALKQEQQCLDQTLAGCPVQTISNIKEALMRFFPSEKCTRTPTRPNVLLFHPRRHP